MCGVEVGGGLSRGLQSDPEVMRKVQDVISQQRSAAKSKTDVQIRRALKKHHHAAQRSQQKAKQCVREAAFFKETIAVGDQNREPHRHKEVELAQPRETKATIGPKGEELCEDEVLDSVGGEEDREADEDSSEGWLEKGSDKRNPAAAVGLKEFVTESGHTKRQREWGGKRRGTEWGGVPVEDEKNPNHSEKQSEKDCDSEAEQRMRGDRVFHREKGKSNESVGDIDRDPVTEGGQDAEMDVIVGSVAALEEWLKLGREVADILTDTEESRWDELIPVLRLKSSHF
jgi:hypothetical protein